MLAVTGVLLFRQPLVDLRPSNAHLPLSVVVGLVVAGTWVLVEAVVPYPHLDARLAFMEELFWRSFLLRYATRADFTSLAVGQFSVAAFWTVVAISARRTPSGWLPQSQARCLPGCYAHTRNLFTAIVAHAAANAALGWYILAAGQWQYW